VAHDRAAVRRDNRGKFRWTEVARRNPARDLLMPHTGVSTQKLPVRLRQIGNYVTLGECEGSTARLRRVPLHGVAGCELTELSGVAQDFDVWSICQLAVVRRGTKVELARRLRCYV
jgi:hypothetical protein